MRVQLQKSCCVKVGSVDPLFFVSSTFKSMNSEILAGLDFFERDKGIKREVLLEAMNTALG